MDLKTAVFKEIGCEGIQQLIELCTEKKTDPITWGRLLQHLRGCKFCQMLFIQFHQSHISDIAHQVIKLEILAEHRHYSLAEKVSTHFTKEQIGQYPDGDFTKDEKKLMQEHTGLCHQCKVPVDKS